MGFRYLVSFDSLWLHCLPKGVDPDTLKQCLSGERARGDVLTVRPQIRNARSLTHGWWVGWLVGLPGCHFKERRLIPHLTHTLNFTKELEEKEDFIVLVANDAIS